MEDFVEKFEAEATDKELVETINHWKNESETYHEKILSKQKISLEYYHGKQTDVEDVPGYLSNTVENRIFEATETLVPIVTANVHKFTVLPGSEDEKAVARAENLQLVHARKYETLNIQEKLEEITRDMIVQRFGVLKYEWDHDIDDIGVVRIDPKLILVPRIRVNPHKLPYVIELQGYSRSELEEDFPKIKPDDVIAMADRIEVGDRERKDDVQVLFTTTDEYWVWSVPGKILDRMANPYWDFAGTKEKVTEIGQSRKKRKEILKFFNHLNRPEKPYIFFGAFNLSDGPLPKTSIVEVAIPIADSINVQKRAIINNLRMMGNGQVYVDSDSMTEEQAANMTNKAGLVLRGEGLASEGKIKREPGVPLPNAHFANLQHSEQTFDNLFGVHSATRGAAQAKTLGQDILSRQQDFTRGDMITRVLNRGVARLANGLTQLMKMFYTENHVIKILGEEGAITFVNLNRDEIDDHIEIYVKGDAVLPMDEVSKRTEAVQLWQLGALDPTTLFERLKFPNPEKSAQRLILWKQGLLDQETQAKIQQDSAAEQAKAQFNPGAGAAGGGSARASSNGQVKRNIETPSNVLQRARANLGGTAPTK